MDGNVTFFRRILSVDVMPVSYTVIPFKGHIVTRTVDILLNNLSVVGFKRAKGTFLRDCAIEQGYIIKTLMEAAFPPLTTCKFTDGCLYIVIVADFLQGGVMHFKAILDY